MLLLGGEMVIFKLGIKKVGMCARIIVGTEGCRLL